MVLIFRQTYPLLCVYRCTVQNKKKIYRNFIFNAFHFPTKEKIILRRLNRNRRRWYKRHEIGVTEMFPAAGKTLGQIRELLMGPL